METNRFERKKENEIFTFFLRTLATKILLFYKFHIVVIVVFQSATKNVPKNVAHVQHDYKKQPCCLCVFKSYSAKQQHEISNFRPANFHERHSKYFIVCEYFNGIPNMII